MHIQSDSMKIHSLCIVKNEGDIINQVLTAATKWSDYIYVFDNGSNDSTWEQVIALSNQYEQIVPYKKDACRWSSQLRGQIFNHYRDNLKPGDWCCRLDADEIYIDNPIDFLAKVPSQYQIACAAMLTYYFSDKDYEKYIQNPSSFSDDVPIEEKCRYYRNDASEIRFFRYKDSLTWPSESECLIGSDFKDWPTGLKGSAFPTRIRLKNYRYRSPEQIQKRLDVRRKHTERGLFPQEMQYRWKELSANIVGSQDFWHWKSRVADSKQLDYDSQDGSYDIREGLMPDMDGILERYDIKITIKNFFRYYVGRPLKRRLSSMGLLSRPFPSKVE